MTVTRTLFTTLSMAVALALTIALAPAAQAGKAHSGQVTPGKSSVLSKAAQKLVGTWRMVAFEMGTTRRPMPTSRNYTVTLKGDGTLSMHNMPLSKKLAKARWNVKGKHVVVTTGKKVQKFGYSLRANELAVTMPNGAKYRIILHRMATKKKP